MLREARIVMPTLRGTGQLETSHTAHGELRHQLIEAFGGYTATDGTGGWFDGQERHLETVMVYDVAIEAERDATWDTLFQIAMKAGHELGQQAVQLAGILSFHAGEYASKPNPAQLLSGVRRGK